MIAQGDIWWAEPGDPIGCEAGYRRPVVFVQCDALNGARMATVLCVPLTGTLRWADAIGSVLLHADATGLEQDSVANASLTFAVGKAQLIERVGQIERRLLDRVPARVGVVLGR